MCVGLNLCYEPKVSAYVVLCPGCIIQDALEALAISLVDLPRRVAAVVNTVADVDMVEDVDVAQQCEPFYILSSS